LEQVEEELRKQGLESCNLILAIDATQSNTWTGKHSFGGRCLHEIAPASARSNQEAAEDEDPGAPEAATSSMRRRGVAAASASASASTAVAAGADRNPYERAIATIARTLAPFDEDGLIPAYVFGDVETKNTCVKSLRPDGRVCRGLDEVLTTYRTEAPKWMLSGPTCFAPAIRKAMKIVKDSGNQFHVLVIIADGQVTVMEKTVQALREASSLPLAIVVIGVGDGPWEQLETLDDHVSGRRFDNLQAVFFHEIERRATNIDASFALAALQELPDQFRACRSLGLLGAE
jgi:hypothetical protein